jgi:hypothetical protein
MGLFERRQVEIIGTRRSRSRFFISLGMTHLDVEDLP